MNIYAQVSTATDPHKQAMNLARILVQAKLAASAQIVGPVTSLFWHLGKFGPGQEGQPLPKRAGQ